MNLLLGVTLVLGLMIMIHEWGHFIIARLFGVRVDVFSIGFGPRLFGWDAGATAPSGSSDELMSKPRWQRALISFAGPAVNLIFPVIALTILFVAIGVPHSSYLDQPVQVVATSSKPGAPPSPFLPGDKVLTLNGISNPTWDQATKSMKDAGPNSTISAEVENAGSRRILQVTLSDTLTADRLLGYPPLNPVLDEVASGSPADRAGLKESDVIQSVDGQKIQYWGQFVDRVRGSDGKPVALDIDRKGQPVRAVVIPMQGMTESGEKIYQVGVAVRDRTSYRRAGLIDGTRDALSITGERIAETLGVVGKLFSGRVSVKQLQGAVGISRAAGEAVRKGPLAVLSLMVLISVNLGILNLLPIPILDGGNILLLAIEGSMRRDLSMAFKERFVQVGFVFLLVLFAYVMYNDVMRMLPTHS